MTTYTELLELNKQLLQRIDNLEKELGTLKKENTELKIRCSKLEAENIKLKQENAELKAENKALREKNTELKRRLNMNSDNSSTPPSKNPIGYNSNKGKDTNNSLRPKSDKKQGGQGGHDGKNLSKFTNPDEEITYTVDNCKDCNSDLSSIEVDHNIHRQVIDIPPVLPKVTNHIGEVKICPCCGNANYGTFPPSVVSNVQYGPNIHSMLIYLSVNHLLPYQRLTQVVRDMIGLNIAKDTIARSIAKLALYLQPFLHNLELALNSDYVKHVDETGLKVCMKLKYLHSLSTSWATLYKVTDKRGDIYKGGNYGVLVHDEWKPYMMLDNIGHALCNTHHLRELKNIKENHNEDWAEEMAALLSVAHWHCEILGSSVSDDYYLQIETSSKRILKKAIKYHEGLEPLSQKKRGSTKRRKGHNLALRLLKYLPENLLFLKDKRVPFTNNMAEQALRMCKVQQKISGTFRTQKAADAFFAVRSLIETARKMGLNIIKTISDALNLKFPELPMPVG